jgi:hypothetical protein
VENVLALHRSVAAASAADSKPGTGMRCVLVCCAACGVFLTLCLCDLFAGGAAAAGISMLAIVDSALKQ